VLDQVSRTMIAETAGKSLDQPDRPVGRAQQQRPGIRGHRPAVTPGALQRVQNQTNPRYILSASGSPCLRDKPLSQNDFLRSRAAPRCTTPFEKSGLVVSNHRIDTGSKSFHGEGLDHHLHAEFHLNTPERGVLGVAGNEQHFQPG
jgi:hypothetical protein